MIKKFRKKDNIKKDLFKLITEKYLNNRSEYEVTINNLAYNDIRYDHHKMRFAYEVKIDAFGYPLIFIFYKNHSLKTADFWIIKDFDKNDNYIKSDTDIYNLIIKSIANENKIPY